MIAQPVETSTIDSFYAGVDLESRFGHLFQSLDKLPGPAPFSGKPKSYPSKNGNVLIFILS